MNHFYKVFYPVIFRLLLSLLLLLKQSLKKKNIDICYRISILFCV